MKNWIHWLWQQWEWEGCLSPELTREIVQVEEALLSGFTPEQRQLYEALEEVRARRDLREQESVFRAGVLLGGGLVAEILGRTEWSFRAISYCFVHLNCTPGSGQGNDP